MTNNGTERRDVAVIYRSYHETIQQLPEDYRLPVYEAIFEYALNGTEPDLSGIPAAIFMLIKPTLDASRQKSENGRKGGKQNGRKAEANDKQSESKPEANSKQNESKAEATRDKRQEIKDKGQGIKDESKTSPPSASLTPTKEKKNPVSHKFGEYGHVFLTDDQHKNLIIDYGEQKITEYIKRCDEYVQQTGRKYKDFNLTIRNWIKKDGFNKTTASKNTEFSSFNVADIEKLVAEKYRRLGQQETVLQ